MSLEIKIDGDSVDVRLISREGSIMKVSVSGRIYEVDFEKVGKGIYSILHCNHSYNVELVQGKSVRDYYVNTPHQSFELEIVDAQARYENARMKGEEQAGVNTIVSPMPGKVVRVLVKTGDKVEKGDPVIVISAMKMESEYKAGVAGVIKKILVSENDTVESHQTLVVIE